MRVKVSGVRKIAISSDYIKLDSLLKLASIVGTGGEAKFLIMSGEVFLNGELCEMRGKKVHPGDVVRCRGETLAVVLRGGSQ